MWEPATAAAFGFGTLILGTAAILYFAFRPRKCPSCRRRRVNVVTARDGLVVLKCDHCGRRYDCDEGEESNPDNWRAVR